MPLSSAFQEHRLLEYMLRIRRRVAVAYGFAIFSVTTAALARWAMSEHLLAGLPYVTLFPAIVLATFFGGFGPGVLATLLSAATAWFLFLPSADPNDWISLALFLAMAGINVALVGLLNRGLEHLFDQRNGIRTLIESAPNGLVLVDEQGTIKLVNAATERLFGYPRRELVGQKMDVLFPILTAQPPPGTYQSTATEASPAAHARRKDRSEFPAQIMLNPLSVAGHKAVLATVVDISERKRFEDGQLLLIRELHHRMQNLFAVIQSVVHRTLMDGQARQVLVERLQALAHAHTLLAETAWEGAVLDDLLKRQVAAFVQQLEVSGCNIAVNALAAQHFALIIHELTTNAAKYGALSTPEGRVRIEGRMDAEVNHRCFIFSWHERGGPAIASPTRKGFGTVILTEAARQFAYDVSMDYSSHGFRYELRLSLERIERAPPHRVPLSAPPAA